MIKLSNTLENANRISRAMTIRLGERTEPRNTVLFMLLIGAAILLLVYHVRVITFPYQSEYREGSMIQTTNTLLNGENPYSIVNQPQDTNTYGIFYSIVCYPFAKMFGSNLRLHRAVSGIFILLSCFIVFLFARTKKQPFLPSLTVSLILYASLLYRTTPLVRPDSLGLFLFLLSLYIPFKYDYSLRSLLTSIIIGVLAFFTKTFFLLTYPFLGSYLFLFVSKKKGVTYSVFSCIILIVSALIMNLFCETYIPNVFFTHINLAHYDFRHMINQLHFGGISQVFILVMFVFAMSSVILQSRKRIRAWITDFNFVGSISNSFDMQNFDSPFFRLDIKCIWYYFLCAAAVFCLSLGGHGGAWMTYFYELILPFFLLVLLDITACSSIPRSSLYLMIAGIINLAVFYMTVLPHYTFRQVQPEWQQIYESVSGNSNVFNSPAITVVLQEQNKRVYDSGDSEYFGSGILPKMFLFISPYWALDRKITQALERYQRNVAEAVKNKEYDVIIITDDYKYSAFPAKSLLPQYYDRKTTLSAPMPQTGQKWKLAVWTKKQVLIHSD
jgi:hypothetical protein